jgi:hypothetical protein
MTDKGLDAAFSAERRLRIAAFGGTADLIGRAAALSFP